MFELQREDLNDADGLKRLEIREMLTCKHEKVTYKAVTIRNIQSLKTG